MNQPTLIKGVLVGVPAGMIVIGIISLFFFDGVPEAGDDQGNRAEDFLRAPVNEEDLRRWVERLSMDIGPRPGSDVTKSRICAKWIESELSEENMGYRPEVRFFEVDGIEYRNVEAQLPGTTRAAEVVVVGAHYDSVAGSPGANDNATGVAAMLALAQAFTGLENARTLRFVAFANEEPPYFQTESMGSLVYARACREKGEKIVGMISLESLGYYSDEKNSQRFPPGLRKFYPDTGNFVGIVGDESSKPLVEEFYENFRSISDFPVQKAALPDELPGIGWSDHWSFWQNGYQALMVTDTATYRYPHYHKLSDTPDKIDFTRYTRVVKALSGALKKLVNP
ncbi:MAG: M28 family peptidase [Verrucomicrobiales bacterium]|nr:M28 family peptidase [Verrucomicrobiales bacterium]